MSAENVELVRKLYEATSAGRMDARFELLAPDVEFHVSGAFPDLERIYRGHAGVRKVDEQLNAPWERISLFPDRLIDLGEQVLALCHFEAVGRDGIQVNRPLGHLWTVRHGQAARLDAFPDHAAALEAVGLSE